MSSAGQHLAETMVSNFLNNKLSVEHIKTFYQPTVNQFAVTQVILDKLPEFIVKNELTFEGLCDVLKMKPSDALAMELAFLAEKDLMLAAIIYNHSGFIDKNEFEARCLASEAALSDKGMRVKEIELLKIIIFINEMTKTSIEEACEIINKHNLTPAESAVFLKLNLPEGDIALVRKLDPSQIHKINLLANHGLSVHIKTEKDLDDALKLATLESLNEYAKMIEGIVVVAPIILETYGPFKLIDVVSRYQWEPEHLAAVFSKLIEEKGLFAKYDNDLDRLAKIVQDPGLTNDWKQKFMDARHSPAVWIELEKNLKAIENNSWELWFSGNYSKVEDIWPGANSELVAAGFVPTETVVNL